MPPEVKMINQDDPTKVWDILKRIDICMFVSFSGTGLMGRPMSTIPKPDEHAIYLLIESTSSAATDVAQNSRVLLSYQGGGDHVSVGGAATIDADKTLVKRLWSTDAQAFWPDGPEASNVVAVVVRPDQADYWDGPGAIAASGKFLFGLVTGQPPQLGERGVVNL